MTKGGRPLKYDWTSIEKAYIQGADIEDICKKYKGFFK